MAEQVAALGDRTRRRLAAHRVRADLDDRDGLAGVQCLLIRGLERLGDLEAAREVAEAALAELPGDALAGQPERDLLTAALRVAGTRTGRDDDPVIQHAVTLAQANGPLLPLEARV